MSSNENKLPRSPKATSSSKTQANAAASPASPSSSSAETLMDQHLNSTLLDPSAPPTPPEVMSSTVPAQSDSPVDPVQPKPPKPPTPPKPPVQSQEPLVQSQEPTESAPADASASSTAATAPTGQAAQNPTAPDLTAPAPVAETSTETEAEAAAIAISRQQPIPPASEPMQYRAIGLVRGKYTPSEEQFTRGTLLTEDGTPIDSVLLGRVMSLVKKHLDLEQPHLWVVYPRTNEREYSLHVQIVGVWEPENLKKDTEGIEASSSEEAEAKGTEAEGTEAIEAEAMEAEVMEAEAIEAEAEELSQPAVEGDTLDLDDRYFSVRGEVVAHSPDNEQLLVKIRRSPRQGSDQSKIFKVVLKGKLEGKVVGYFWDFNVKREGDVLVVQDATLIKIVPPQKGGGDKFRGGPRRGGPGGARKPWSREGGRPMREGSPRPQRGDRPTRPMQRDRGDRPEQGERKEPISKPIIKRRDKDASS
jgi:hypothetical protein